MKKIIHVISMILAGSFCFAHFGFETFVASALTVIMIYLYWIVENTSKSKDE